MQPQINIAAPPTTPAILLGFVHYLSSTHPLHNTKHLYWIFQNRDLCAKGAKGFACAGTYKGLKYTTLRIALGFLRSQRTEQELLHTVAHEYKHALQYDADLTRQGPTSSDEELEACEFARVMVGQFQA
jgi:hypothetical protein